MRIHILALSAVLFCAGIPAIGRQPLTFQERVKAQEAIERVYYNHRIWPKENPGPKPPFEQMVPEAQIEAKVTDYLKKSAALDRFWQRPLTGDQLQAEMDRMAKGTQNAATLIELFAALGNDPDLAAECLVRPILADRLVRNWYAYDGRFHGERGREAQAALAAGNLAWASLPGIQYERGHRTLVEGNVPRISGGEGTSGSWELDEEAFRRWMGEVPAEGQSVLRETEEGFILIHTERVADNRWDGERGFLEKRSWDEWWNDTQRDLLPENDSIWTEGRRRTPILKAASPLDCGIGDGWAQQSSLLNAMDPVCSRTGVWTGTEMIVWGGRSSGSTYLQAGGRYNPSTDSWLPTSTGTNCPAKRDSHTAVWTGSDTTYTSNIEYSAN